MTHHTTAPGGNLPRTADPVEPPPSRGRRIAFRVIAGLLGLWLLVISFFGLTEVVLMWLPAETVGDMVPDGGSASTDIEHHRTHFFAIGLVAWGVVPALLVQLRRPERRTASMLFLLVSATTSLVVFALHGTVGEWLLEEWTWFVPVVALAALHPARARLGHWPGHDRVQLGLALVAALPWLAYAVVNASRELTRSGGEHAIEEHWAIAAWLGVVVVAAAVLGGSRHHGWQLPAWYAAIASILFGAHSLVFPDLASALWTPFAVAAILWGVAYAAATVARTRAAAPA